MKINSIQKFSNIKNVHLKRQTNSIKSYPNDSFELSFTSRIKHSSEFLEITKNNRDMRNKLTSLCMIGDDGEFSKIAQETFVEYYKTLKYVTSQNERDFLTSIALALKLDEENSYANSPRYMAEIEMMSENYGLDDDEIKKVFSRDVYDFNLPHAYVLVKEISEEVSTSDIILFLTRYCKTKENITDIVAVEQLYKLFNLMGADELDLADLIYSITLDDDCEYNRQKAEFILDATKMLFDYCAQEENSCIFVSQQQRRAKNLVILAMKSLIVSNEKKNDGKFDYDSALLDFKTWFEYAKENKDEINNSQKMTVFDPRGKKVKTITISKAMKDYPEIAVNFNNTLYRFTSLLANFTDDIEQ